jgi:hypothetical protein
MMQTVGVLPPAAQMQAGGQPAAGYPLATRRKAQCRTAVAPTRKGRPSAVRRWRRHCGPGSGGGDSACRRAGGYPAAAGGGPAIVYATAAPVAYGNGAPAVDTSAITMGIVLPAVAGGSEEAPPPASFMCRGEVSY